MIGWQLEVFWPLYSKHLFAEPLPPSPPRPRRGGGASLRLDDIFMALVRHQHDIIMQHAGAQEDHCTQRPFVLSRSPVGRLMRRRSRSRLLMLRFGAFGLLVG